MGGKGGKKRKPNRREEGEILIGERKRKRDPNEGGIERVEWGEGVGQSQMGER